MKHTIFATALTHPTQRRHLAMLRFSLRMVVTILTTVLVFSAVSLQLQAQSISVSGTSFDSVACGSSSCHSLVFRNTGNTPATIEALGVLGSIFTLEDAHYTPPYTLQPGDTLALLFCYHASVPPGPAKDSITVQLTGVAQPTVVVLSGVSIAPKMAVSQSTIDFGIIIVGTAKQVSVIVTNQGDGNLTVPNASGVAPPFYVVQGAGAVIPPGKSDTLSFLYAPITSNTDQTKAVFGNPPCLANTTLSLVGTAVNAPPPSIGAVLQINPSAVAFDTAMCGETKKLPVQFLNIGSDTLLIRSVTNPPVLPFAGFIPTTRIAPSKDSVVTISYTPMSVPSIDSQTVTIVADTRQSLSIGMLFDLSGSMSSSISSKDATIRLRAAKDAGKIFLSQLITDQQRNVVDEAQIMSFSSPANSFKIRSPFTTNRGLSALSIDTLVATGSTCLYESLIQAVDSIKSRPHPVLVLLSDGGEGGCNISPAFTDVIAAISTSHVRVFVVGIVDSTTALATTLRQIAAAGNGTASFAVTQQDITNGFINIARQLSQNITVQIPLSGRSVAPLLTMTPLSLSFDSVKVGNERCLSVSVRNTGTAAVTLHPDLFSGTDPQFTVSNLPVTALQPGASAENLDVCFRPTSLRQQASTMNLSYNLCRTPLQIDARGIGYDSVVVQMDTVIRNALIGDTVTVPILLRSLIPKSYAVDSMAISLSYNSTVLALIGARTNSTLSSVYTSPLVSGNFADLLATDVFHYSGGTLVNTITPSTLSSTAFRVLRGNAMSSDLRISSMSFADGNPKVGIIQPATVQLDPVCYLSQRLIDPSKRIGQAATLQFVRADGAGNVGLRFRVAHDAPVHIVACDALGRVVGQWQGLGNAGADQECSLRVSARASTPVYVRLSTDDASDAIMFVMP